MRRSCSADERDEVWIAGYGVNAVVFSLGFPVVLTAMSGSATAALADQLNKAVWATVELDFGH
ncbi:uncharacterized protein K452DRAFT_288559 [Aplosporella prunicola CBS 121167]|uniref:Uncharacterized protein n=1 Tax=Aplosporella prunicola CBS 121167 TaxID=1176127 RepID=A0A6A6BDC1_9PEZI|nr:uncharacterized protein K452DRAFT_288559 [Aplosporella prunicola CBS 121167]KAF2140471.1 hypothetical protein K452DRAFT_288559 [Aplosporella prunicola CBS 121167]